MATFIEQALKTVLEGKFDVAEHKIGRYHVWMKWDGYSAMVDITYLTEDGQHDFTICQWDSLDKRIALPDEDNLHGTNREKVNMAIQAIQLLGYQLNQICLYASKFGHSAYEDVTDEFIKLIA
ncbi:hypothetical protein PP175_25650 (plasmid) [Aneurinibacillus sp. Ricciae_BoGa-3]|uniref:hypothetical protein n=1 Tax=Aneurinibacillus sp. Ricciae_BoGa-3 TaxID=3022697 RepID=UPI0023401996|nr:hypothetical protein [Aneurinibacillus sp. Ricciae_BoGa-3]WCK57455.1 hypothetical protein PP175_25650 [Aneurinibacillus sp. Ricciae_BoGa-3]